jgi:hypothetical protein
MTSRTIVAGLVLLLGVTSAVAVDAARRAGPPPVVMRYREALRAWLPGASAASLDAVDLSGTVRARPTALAFIAVDHAVRRFAPLAIEATGRPGQSVRLRRLPPISGRASALWARTSIALTYAALQSSATMSRQPRIESAMTALRAAERAVVYAAQITEACPENARTSATCGALLDGTVNESSTVASLALATGAEEHALVEAALESLRAMGRAPGTR